MSQFLQIERLTRVEEQVSELRNKVDAMDEKIDELLAIRYKGVGAFWLASALMGTGIIGFFVKVLHLFGTR